MMPKMSVLPSFQPLCARYINTSFQHYCHHAKSLMNRPYHCGFFIKLWDNMFQ